jgi:inner membrane protein
MAQRLAGFRSSVTAKVLTIGVILLLMLIPLKMIEGLVADRDREKGLAEAEIAQSWGNVQTVGGPVVIVPFRHRRFDSQGAERLLEDELYLFPLELTIEGGAEMQVLSRGIFEVPVYSASLSVTGRLRPVEIDAASYDGLEVLWNEAEIGLPVGDPRALRNEVTIELGGDRLAFESGDTRIAGLGPMLRAPLAGIAPDRFDESQPFSLALSLAGTGGLYFRPDGDLTRVTLESGWPSPSFRGAYLPEQRAVDANGFSAAWRVMGIGRGYPAVWRKSDIDIPAANARQAQARRITIGPGPQAQGSTFGAEFLVPVSVHTSSLRAIKYAELYLAVTFTAFFLFEIFMNIRLHPVQYLSVGLANGIFYLLLLALAEHSGFLIAYLASAVGATGLIGGYAAAVLGGTRRALPIVGLLAALYLYLYTTLRAEDYALVAGALGLFVLLGAFMYLTRGVDWYAIELGPGDGPTSPEAARPA